MKKILYSLLLCAVLSIKAQVKIGGTMGGTFPANIALQLEANDNAKGVLYPRVDLISLTQKAPITTANSADALPGGLLVYNKKSDSDNNFLPKGYYYWENSKWNLINFQETDSNFVDIITAEQLGYTPTTTTGNSVTVSASKLRCVKWDELIGGNGHVYCVYNATSSLSWNDAYLIGKNSGGYLPVITSNREWNFIKNNVIIDGTTAGGGTFTANAWLGFNRDAFLQKGATVADYKYRYRWITGEIPLLDFGSSTATTENQFTNVNPIPADNISQNCGRINTSVGNWSVVDCTTNNTSGLILEFNQ